jgi:hypothetical protein
MNPSSPPPLPPTHGFSQGPIRLAGQMVAGTEGMSLADLQQAVARGGRFVFFQYCFSVLILSFKRSSPIVFVRPGESAFAKGLPYSLISLVAGWWGIPWGPIWTIWTVAVNLGGGKDVTAEALHDLGLNTASVSAAPPPLAPAEEVTLRPKQKSSGLVWKFVIAGLIVLSAMVCWVGFKFVQAVKNHRPTPGEAEFRARNNHIGSGGTDWSGNKPAAERMAAEMTKRMRTLRDQYFEKAEKKSVLDEHDGFRTYVDLRDNQCVVLIHVPELRRFNDDAKKSLGEIAWFTAQSLLAENSSGNANMKLAVGLRGIAAYDRLLLGKFQSKATKENSGLNETRTDFSCERELYSWFALPSPATNTNATR